MAISWENVRKRMLYQEIAASLRSSRRHARAVLRTAERKNLSLRGRQAAVTEGNACGAISWENVRKRTQYQEIAASLRSSR